MKHFNKFKNQLRPENFEMPDGLGWDEMQDGIFDKMDDKPLKAKKFIFNYKKFFTSLIILMCLLPLLLMLIHEDNSKNEIASNSIEVKTDENKNAFINSEELDKDHILQNKTIDRELDTELNSSNYLPAKQSNQESAKQLTQKEINSSITIKSKYNINPELKFEIKKDNINEEPIYDFDINTTKLNNDDDDDGSVLNISDFRNNQNSEEGVSDENKILSKDESSIIKSSDQKLTKMNTKSSIHPASKNNQQSKYLNHSIVLPLRKANEIISTSNTKFKDLAFDIPTIKPLRKKLWSLELGSGWNTWNYGLTGADLSNQLFENTHSEYGFSYSFRIGRRLNDRFSINSGIDLDYLYKRLEVNYNDYHPRMVDSTLLSYTLNYVNGEKSDLVYGDTIVVDTVVNSLTDYNRFRIVQIPLIVNYKLIQNDSWMIEAGFGPSISMLINYSGKFVENDDLHSYQKAESIYSTSPKLALNASVKISKNLGGSYYLGLKADFRNHISSWSNQSGTAMKPKMISGLITVGKSF